MSHIPRVVVYVEGGLIQAVMADQEVKIMVVDLDIEGSDDERIAQRTNAAPAFMSLLECEPGQDGVQAIQEEFSDYERHHQELEEQEAVEKMIEERPEFFSPAVHYGAETR